MLVAYSAACEASPPFSTVYDPRMQRRGGRPLGLPGGTAVALTLRRQREALGFSLRGLAQRSGVSVFRLAEFEHSRRTPDPDEYRRLQEVLALEDVPERDRRLTETALTTISACLAWTHGVPVATLAAALGLSVSEIRDGVDLVRDRLLAIGLDVSVDQKRARVAPVSWCGAAVQITATVSPLTPEDIEVLAILHERDGAQVAELEDIFGSTTQSQLASLSDRGLVSCALQGQVGKRRYWVTDHGLMAAAEVALRRSTAGRSDNLPT